MQLGIVIGSVWSTRKEESLTGLKFMLVKPLDVLHIEKELLPFVAVDLIGAGVGETVLTVSGSSARSAVRQMEAPVDAAIVGIVDDREVDASLLPEGAGNGRKR